MGKIYPFVMSGGSGTRLWPLSRQHAPKQHLALTAETTLLDQTLARLQDIPQSLSVAAPSIICSAPHCDFIEKTLDRFGLHDSLIVVEQAGRNTAPVAAIAALMTERLDPEGHVLLLPADHYIADTRGFWSAVEKAFHGNDGEHITTLGITPTQPHTGYGYIRAGASLGDGLFAVDAFVEKPDMQTALTYLQSGGYFWNAGIFLFPVAAMIDEFRRLAPDILAAADATLGSAPRDGRIVTLKSDDFSACRAVSLDYAIMEHTDRAAVVAPVTIGWSDVGSWTAVAELSTRGDDLNVGLIDCDNAYAHTTGPYVAALGVKDVVIIATPDAVLVAPRDRTQEIGKIVERLKQAGREDLL